MGPRGSFGVGSLMVLGVGADETISPFGLCKAVIIPDIHRKSRARLHALRAIRRSSRPRSAGRGPAWLLARAGGRRSRRWRRGVARAATPPPFRAAHAAVASDNALASAAGVTALKGGGNAVDAACATALALGVVHPDSSGIGGGGFAIVYLAKEKKSYALDFRERAPAAITPAASSGRKGPSPSCRSAAGWRWRCRARCAAWATWSGAGASCRSAAASTGRRSWPRAGSPSPGGWPRNSARRSIARRPTGDKEFLEMLHRASRSPEGAILRRPELACDAGASCARAAPTPSTRARSAKEIVKAVTGAGGVLTARGPGRLHRHRADAARTTTTAGCASIRCRRRRRAASSLVETLGILAAHYPTTPICRATGAGRRPTCTSSPRRSSMGSPIARASWATPDFVAVDLAHLTTPPTTPSWPRRIKPDAVLPRDAYGTLGAPAGAAQRRRHHAPVA